MKKLYIFLLGCFFIFPVFAEADIEKYSKTKQDFYRTQIGENNLILIEKYTQSLIGKVKNIKNNKKRNQYIQGKIDKIEAVLKILNEANQGKIVAAKDYKIILVLRYLLNNLKEEIVY